jgi:inhibitor of KinA
LGERAFVVYDLPAPAYRLAGQINASRPSWLSEACPSYDTLGLYVSEPTGPSVIEALITATRAVELPLPKTHRIPVCYELGEDLIDAASELELSPNALIEAHSGVTYTCYAVGFTPGFPYLGYLPDRIAGLSRRKSPRVSVPTGAVGIAGNQTGIYPASTPGGWQLIGRTPLTLVDLAGGYFPISAGDGVLFRAIGREEFHQLEGQRL